MRYVIHAYDGTDPDAPARRMAARAAHFEGARRLDAEGHFVLGGALLDAQGQMIGSMLLLDFDQESQIQEWLAWEPYCVQRVWDKIDIRPFLQATI